MALEDNKVWHVKRVRLVNGEPLCFEDDYCNYDLTGDIPLEVSVHLYLIILKMISIYILLFRSTN